jgi:hypothetical protein
MTRIRALFAAPLLLALAPAAFAQPAPAPGAPGHWSVATGETVSTDRDAIALQAGWPGLSFAYLHGLSDRSDVGARFDLLLARENTTDSAFGAGFDVPLRLVMSRADLVTIGVQIEPGLRIYTQNSQTDFMTRFPVGGVLGIQATPELRLALTADLSMAVVWTHTQYFEIAPMFGAAAEYKADKNLLLGLQAKFGPQFYTVSGSQTDFAFSILGLVGYRM